MIICTFDSKYVVCPRQISENAYHPSIAIFWSHSYAWGLLLLPPTCMVCLVAEEFLWTWHVDGRYIGKRPNERIIIYFLLWKCWMLCEVDKAGQWRIKLLWCTCSWPHAKCAQLPIWNPRAIRSHNFHPRGIVAIAGLSSRITLLYIDGCELLVIGIGLIPYRPIP